MSIDQLKDQIPDFAKDLWLNLASMMADETLPPQSKYGLLLASAIATRNPAVTAAMETAAGMVMTPAAVEAAKSAASVMAMNNVYYRFVHLVSNPDYKTMAARLRMNWLGNPRVDRADFGCGHWQRAQSTGAAPAWTPTRRRCGNPASARTQFQRPCALPPSCNQLPLQSRRQGVARRKRRSSSPSPPPRLAPPGAGSGCAPIIRELSSPSVPLRPNI